MQVNQIYSILNDVMVEVTGGQIDPDDAPATPIVQEDLSNIVEVGTLVFSNNWKDNYVKALINRIGPFRHTWAFSRRSSYRKRPCRPR